MAGFTRFCAPRRILHKVSVTHGSAGAAEYGSTVTFSVSLPEGATDAEVVFLCDDDGEAFSYALDGGKLTVTAKELCRGAEDALLFYKIRFRTGAGAFQITLAPDGISDTIADRTDGFENAYQLTIYRKRDVLPDKLAGGIMYQIFPDRFFRGGREEPRADARLDPDWYEGIPPYVRGEDDEKTFKNNVFFGGDLKGIEKKIDYLKSLGVTVIYLNPIFEAYSNHKYDTACYDRVDEMFGGEKAFSSLVSAAKRKGIEIILDGVFNHTGDDSVYFNKYGRYGDGGAYRDPDSPYRAWFNFESYPDKYESWWGIDVLPRVKCDEPSYKNYILGKNGVVRKRLREGVAGFRLDVADELSDEFLKELKSAALEEKADACIIGEVWENASNKVSYGARRKYLRGKELDSVMNYPLRKAIIAYLRNGDYMKMIRTVSEVYDNYPPETAALLMNVVGTHDTERIITALVGRDAETLSQDEKAAARLSAAERSRGETLVRMAYLISSVMPGIPCIYYGDEIGMEGYADPFCRLPFKWGQERKDVLDFYRRMGRIRTEEKALFCGDFRIVYADSDVLCVERRAGGKFLCAIVNRGTDTYVFSSSADSTEKFTGKTKKEHEIAPGGYAIIVARDGGEDYGVNKKI